MQTANAFHGFISKMQLQYSMYQRYFITKWKEVTAVLMGGGEDTILFISFFLYFLIVRKSIRTVKKENDEINGNKEISFDSSKKRDLLI